MTHLSSPKNKQEFQRYYDFRWEYLRKPWHQEKGSEQDELEAVSFHFMLLDDNDKLIAVARLHQVDQTTGQVRYVAVLPSWQGKGLGKKIMDAVEDKAKWLGLTTVELNARENALAFYLSQGYQNLGESHVLYSEIQHFKMTKSIKPTPLNDDVQDLVTTWHETIPMSKAMGIGVTYYDKNELVTCCDLAFNKNLHNTMFAGSINTLATLSGWGCVHLLTIKLNLKGDIVLAQSQMKYMSPVLNYGFAVVKKEDVQENLVVITQGKKAKVTLSCRVYSGDKVAAIFTGTYVVIPK